MTRQITPVSGKARLVLQINDVPYVLRFLDSHPDVGSPAWRLTKAGEGGTPSESYDVILRPHGPECSCPDFNYRRQHEDKKCKHIESCRAVGLLRRDV